MTQAVFKNKHVNQKTLLQLHAFFKKAYKNTLFANKWKTKKNFFKILRWKNIFQNSQSKQYHSFCSIHQKTGEIVAHLGLTPCQLKVGNFKKKAVWGRDMIVHPAYRGFGLGSSLFLHVIKMAKKNYDIFLLAGANPRAVNLYKKIGFTYLGKIPLYLKIIRPWKLLCKVAGYETKPIISKIAEKHRFKKLTSLKQAKELDLKKNYHIIKNLSKKFSNIVIKNSSCLIKKFFHSPFFNYKFFWIYNFQKQIAGYIVIRVYTKKRVKVGVISDLVVNPTEKNVICQCLREASWILSRYFNVDCIRFDILNPLIEKYLWIAGFFKVPSRSHFLVLNLSKKIKLNKIHIRKEWLLTYSDSDLEGY